jgi:methylase of polypeptide subunit release factors
MGSGQEALHGREDPRRSRALTALRELALARNDEIAEALGPGLRFNSRLDSELYRRRLADDHGAAATLAKLFRLTLPVSLADATRALAPLQPSALAELDLAAVDGDTVEPRVRIAAYEGIVLVSDPLDPASQSFVAGPNAAATRVDRLTIRRPVARTLDLGTGAGTQALRAARHSDHVVGVDVNERAIELARLNAELNGVANVELRRGDWLEPVAGERFDLIVSNPPYVVSPETELLYRDGNLVADDVTRMLVTEVPAYLEEGGVAQVMGNWGHAADADWRGPVESWIAGSGCDALLLRFPRDDLVSYAGAWNSELLSQGVGPYVDAVDRWLDYYAREGIEKIAAGMVVLRKRSGGRNWVRALEIPGQPTGAAGEQVLRMIEARDRRDELADDDAVLAARFARAEGLRMTTKTHGPGLAESKTTIELEPSVGFAAQISPELAEALPRLDGSAALGSIAPGVSPAEARRLFSLGLLTILT